jgi:serine/threonine-protein kinase
LRTVQTGQTETLGSDLASGSVVGEYRIDELIGRGGFGTVYRATHPVIGKQVAIKVLSRKYSADPDVVSRFVAEAKAVNQIRQRNIIDIFAFGALDDGRNYYVMEYLDGAPLDRHLADNGPLSLAEALPILRAIAKALDAAHAKGIAHRDMKPENIFLARDPDGTRFPKLLDFGIAKLLAPEEDVRHRTGTGVPIGTPYYMSPEQCRGKEVDHRTDIYSFGIVAYRVLTGAYAFEGEDYLELMNKHTSAEPVPPSQRNAQLTPAVDRAIEWMMKKDRAERPATVLEGVNAMDPSAVTPELASTSRRSAPGVASGATTDPFAKTTANGDGPVAPTPRRARKAGLAVVLVIVVGVAGVVAWQVAKRTGDQEPAVAAQAPARPDVVAPPSPPPPVAAVAIDAPPAVPDHVTIDFTGVPDGAKVSLAGKQLGITPHVPIPFGTAEIQLAIDAKDYEPATVRVKPDHDQEVAPALKKKKKPQQRVESTDSELAVPRGM